MTDLYQKWKVKLFFSRRLKQFDGLTRLTLTHIFYERSTLILLAYRQDWSTAWPENLVLSTITALSESKG